MFNIKILILNLIYHIVKKRSIFNLIIVVTVISVTIVIHSITIIIPVSAIPAGMSTTMFIIITISFMTVVVPIISIVLIIYAPPISWKNHLVKELFACS